MSLEQSIMEHMKLAMKAKDTVALAALRAVKASILKAKTATQAQDNISTEEEIKILHREIKQRRDAAAQFSAQGATEMAEEELAQIRIIEPFLPTQLTEEELTQALQKVITSVGASSIEDFGDVMRVATSELAGKADGKKVSTLVRSLLS